MLELDFSKPLKETGILDVRAAARRLWHRRTRVSSRPGDPYRSVLFYRMAKFGRGRMPHLGSERPDVPRVSNLMAKWIAIAVEPGEGADPEYVFQAERSG